MSKIYEKFITFRNQNYENVKESKDKNKFSNHSHLSYFERSKDVIEQLFILAFCNKDDPDNLPLTFHINKVHFSDEDLKYFFKDIGYDVKVHMLSKNWNDGTASFKVTIVNILE